MTEPEFPKVSWYLTAFVGVMILVTTLAPRTTPAASLAGSPLDDVHAVAAFAGLAFPTAFLDRHGAWAFAVWGPILAIMVEVIQVNYGRDASARNFVLYLLGGTLGVVAGRALRQGVITESQIRRTKAQASELARAEGIKSDLGQEAAIKPAPLQDEPAQPEATQTEPQQPDGGKTRRIK